MFAERKATAHPGAPGTNDAPSPYRRAIQLLLITLAAAGGIYARTAVGPVQEAIRTGLSLSDNEISLLQGPALAFPLVLAAVPLGLCVDRYSRVRLLLVATLLSTVGTVCTALASSFGLLLVARTLVGLAAPATAIAAYSLLADLYSSSGRGRATTVIMLGQVGGSSLAFALGGLLLSQFFDASNGWRWTMLYMAALFVPIIALTLGLREPIRADQVNGKPRAREIWRQLRPYRTFIITLVTGMAMVNLADGAALVWAAPTLSRSFGLHSDRIGTLMALAL
ncbi:MAG TPA: MFS transporter, partial [Steroidobacteraceae bacterium]